MLKLLTKIETVSLLNNLKILNVIIFCFQIMITWYKIEINIRYFMDKYTVEWSA